MEWVDIVVLAVIFVSAVIGFSKGFIREVVFIVAFVLGIMLAFSFATMPEYWVPFKEWNFLGKTITTHNLSYVISFILIVTGSLIIGQFFATMLTAFYESRNPESSFLSLNRLLGFVFGIVRGGLLVIVLIALAGLTSLPQMEAWQSAKTLAFFEDITTQLIQQLPSDYSQHFFLDNSRKTWEE